MNKPPIGSCWLHKETKTLHTVEAIIDLSPDGSRNLVKMSVGYAWGYYDLDDFYRDFTQVGSKQQMTDKEKSQRPYIQYENTILEFPNLPKNGDRANRISVRNINAPEHEVWVKQCEFKLTESIKPVKPEKAKSDRLNLGLTLIPFHSIYRLGKIYLEGLRYGFENWKKGVNDKDFQQERLEHALNHLFLWKEGDQTEDHLAKVMWFCVTQMELERLEGIQPTVSPPTQETEQEFDEVETVAVYMVDGKPVKIKYPNLPDEGEFSHFQHFEIYNMNTVNKILDWQRSLNTTYTKEKIQNG